MLDFSSPCEKYRVIYVFGDLFGVVGVGDSPGYARHASRSGPLARLMEIEGGDEDLE